MQLLKVHHYLEIYEHHSLIRRTNPNLRYSLKTTNQTKASLKIALVLEPIFVYL